MKVIKSTPAAPPKSVPRVRGVVIVDGPAVYMEVASQGSVEVVDKVVNLTTGVVCCAGTTRDCDDVPYPDAVLLLDGQPPLPVPPVKSAEQHTQEFVAWYWGNANRSGATIVQYSVQEILDKRTNAPTRRAHEAWMAARGV